MLFESHKIAWAMQESKQFTEGIYEYYTVPKVHKSWMFWEPNQIRGDIKFEKFFTTVAIS